MQNDYLNNKKNFYLKIKTEKPSQDYHSSKPIIVDINKLLNRVKLDRKKNIKKIFFKFGLISAFTIFIGIVAII